MSIPSVISYYPSTIMGQADTKCGYVIVKPHHEEDIFVITRGRGVNNKDILRVQVGFNWLLSQHGFYTTCLQ